MVLRICILSGSSICIVSFIKKMNTSLSIWHYELTRTDTPIILTPVPIPWCWLEALYKVEYSYQVIVCSLCFLFLDDGRAKTQDLPRLDLQVEDVQNLQHGYSSESHIAAHPGY